MKLERLHWASDDCESHQRENICCLGSSVEERNEMGGAIRFHLIFLSVICFSLLAAVLGIPVRKEGPDNVLKGKNITVSVIHEPPWIIIGGETRPVKGLAAETWRRICDFLGCTVVFKEYSGTFDGFIEEMQECGLDSGKTSACPYHFGGNFWSQNPTRSQQVDFTAPATASNAFVGITRPEIAATREDKWLLLKPFTWRLWLVILAFILINALASFLSKSHAMRQSAHNKEDNGIPDCSAHLSKPVLMVLAGSESSTKEPERHWTARVIDVVTIIVGLLVLVIYEATLTSMRTAEIRPAADFRTIDDLRTCLVDVSRLIVVKDGAAHAHIKRRVLNSDCNLNKKVQTCEGVETCLQQVAEGKADFTFLLSDIANHFIATKYCKKLVKAGSSFQVANLAYPLPKGSPYTPIIDWAILKLNEDGELPKLEDSLPICEPEGEPPTTLLSELFYTALLPGMLILLCVILYLLTKIQLRRKAAKNSVQESSMASQDSVAKTNNASKAETVKY